MKSSNQPPFSRRQHGAVLVFSLATLLLLTLLSVNMIQQNRLQFMMAGNAQQQNETFSAAEDLLTLTENHIDAWHANYSQQCQTPMCRNAANQPVACTSPNAMCAKTDNSKVACNSVNADHLPVFYACYDTTANPPTMLSPFKIHYAPPPVAPTQIILDDLYPCYTISGRFTQLQAADVGANGPPPWPVSAATLGLDAAEIGTTAVTIVSVTCLTDTGIEGDCDYYADGTLSSSNLYCHGDPGQTDLTQCPEENSNYYCRSATQANCPTELYTLQVATQNNNTFAQRTVESKYAVRCDANAGEKPGP